MKIQPGNIDRKKLSRKPSAPEESKSVASSGFKDILESILPSGQDSTKELNELWSHLPDTEKKFISFPSHDNMLEYRKLINEILNGIMKKNVRLETAQRRNRNDQKNLKTVRYIEDKLQVLAKIIVDPSNAAFQLMTQFQDIRGLLLDIK